MSLRGRSLGALLGFGPAAYAIYMVPQYVLGPDYSHLAGNNERWFPLLLIIFGLGLVSAVLAWSQLAAWEPRGSARVESLVGRRLLPGAAAVVFLRYVPTLADWMSASPRAMDYIAGPSFSWTIALLDLGVAVPATVAVCVGHRHAVSWARRGMYGLTAWFALAGAAVAAMAIAMQLRAYPADPETANPGPGLAPRGQLDAVRTRLRGAGAVLDGIRAFAVMLIPSVVVDVLVRRQAGRTGRGARSQ